MHRCITVAYKDALEKLRPRVRGPSSFCLVQSSMVQLHQQLRSMLGDHEKPGDKRLHTVLQQSCLG